MSFFDRRRFLKTTAISSAFLATNKLNAKITTSQSKGKYMGDFIAPRLDKIKIALIGVGYRGQGHIKRFGSIEEIFDLCLFLCSKKNFSTGATFILDGGQTKSFN